MRARRFVLDVGAEVWLEGAEVWFEGGVRAERPLE